MYAGFKHFLNFGSVASQNLQRPLLTTKKVSLVSLSSVENIILKFLKTSFLHLERMFKRYSKNGGETSTFCLVAVLAREAERLSSLRLEYDLKPKLQEEPTTCLRFSVRYHWGITPCSRALSLSSITQV